MTTTLSFPLRASPLLPTARSGGIGGSRLCTLCGSQDVEVAYSHRQGGVCCVECHFLTIRKRKRLKRLTKRHLYATM